MVFSIKKNFQVDNFRGGCFWISFEWKFKWRRKLRRSQWRRWRRRRGRRRGRKNDESINHETKEKNKNGKNDSNSNNSNKNENILDKKNMFLNREKSRFDFCIKNEENNCIDVPKHILNLINKKINLYNLTKYKQPIMIDKIFLK